MGHMEQLLFAHTETHTHKRPHAHTQKQRSHAYVHTHTRAQRTHTQTDTHKQRRTQIHTLQMCAHGSRPRGPGQSECAVRVQKGSDCCGTQETLRSLDPTSTETKHLLKYFRCLVLYGSEMVRWDRRF